MSGAGWRTASIRIADLAPGDLVDLEGDRFADPAGASEPFKLEFQAVARIDRETPGCFAVWFESGFGCGFPPGHAVTAIQAATAASRRRIARLYRAEIGFDPFEDDPTLTPGDALTILRDRRAASATPIPET